MNNLDDCTIPNCRYFNTGYSLDFHLPSSPIPGAPDNDLNAHLLVMCSNYNLVLLLAP